MDYYEAVASQPANLERSAGVVSATLAELDLKPWRDGALAVAAMGASSHAGHALVHRLARYGRRALNIDASELVSYGSGADIADSYVFVSEGGRSRETIEAANLVPAGARLGLTNTRESPLSAAVDAVLAVGHGPDSKVYTVGYTATLQAFGLLASAIDGHHDGEQWAAVPELVSQVLTDLEEASASFASRLVNVASVDFVGSGASRASAAEAALLFREATRTCTATYETHQYLHGPMECLTPRHATVIFGEVREIALSCYLARKGVTTLLVTAARVEEEKNLTVFCIPHTPGMSRAVLQALPPQLVAGELARLLSLRIEGFAYHQDDTKIGPAAG